MADGNPRRHRMRMTPESLRGPSGLSADGTIVVTGASGTLGRAVRALLEADPGAGKVVALGDEVDLLTAELKPLLEGAGTLVHLASVFGPALDDDPAVERADDVTVAQRLLDAAGDAGVEHVVLLSSAAVYGAWANNALPLTEDATLRPCPEMAFAVQRAEIERRLAEWRHDHPGTTATVLRPAPVVGDDGEGGWLARALHEARRVADIEGDAPAQFLHLDDLASAVVLAATARVEGARNVAPDGWLRGAEYTALDAGTPKVRVPRRVGDRLSRLRWRLRLAPTPPGLQPYARHPWVVANDALRADGWEPSRANDEAFVDGTPATALATLSPRRRQEIALGVTGGAVVAAAGGVGIALVRRARSARRGP